MRWSFLVSPAGGTDQPNPMGRDVTAGDLLVTSGDSVFNRAREQGRDPQNGVQSLLKWRSPAYADDDSARRACSSWMTTFEP